MSNNSHLIKEWFFDELENILDELTILKELKDAIVDQNDEFFEEEITHQSYDEFNRSISITCSTKLGLPYDEVYDVLEDKLEDMYHAFD